MRRCVGCGRAQRRPTNSLHLAVDLRRPSLCVGARRHHSTACITQARCLRYNRGAALIVVLVGMAVATMIFLSVLKLIAVQRQSVELQTRQIQAGWLAESAVQRAHARLSAEASYRGETWRISPQDIGGRDGATIAIRVSDVPGKPDRRTVHVEADYPADPNQRARQDREVIMQIPSPRPSPDGRGGQLKGPKP